MGTKTVRIEEEVYERIAAHKREDETFSEAVERLLDDVSLLDLVDGGDYDAKRESRMKERLDRTAEVDSESAPRLGTDDS